MADSLLDQVRVRFDTAAKHVSLAEGLLARAVSAGDLRTAVAAVSAAVNANREVRSVLELQSKLLIIQAASAHVDDVRALSDEELDSQIRTFTLKLGDAVLTEDESDRRILALVGLAREREAAAQAAAVEEPEPAPIVLEVPPVGEPPIVLLEPVAAAPTWTERVAAEPSHWTKKGW